MSGFNCRLLCALLISGLVLTEAVTAGRVKIDVSETAAMSETVEGPASSIALRFAVTAIPEGVTVDRATLYVPVNSDSTFGSHVEVSIAPAAETWSASAVPQRLELSTVDTTRTFNFCETGADATLEIDVTQIVRLWMSERLPNHGFVASVVGNDDREFSLSDGVERASLIVFYSR